jgi:uncharacterized protein involved in tellurium resistance
MSWPAPENAPKRTDLPFLAHRSRPRPVAVAEPSAPAVAVSGQAASDQTVSDQDAKAALADFIRGRTTRSGPAASSSLDLSAPAPTPASAPATSSSLDLSGPAPAQPPATASSSSLDLSDAPAPTPQPAPTSSSSLDLSDAPVAAPPPPASRRARPVHRTRKGVPTLLSPSAPSVNLTRLQAGIGTLTFEAAWSEAVGDLRLGCAYQLRSGLSSTLQLAAGNRFAPPNSRRPVIVAHRDEFEQISIDLRQCQDLERLVVYGFSVSRAQINWGGTLVVTTFGQDRIELPIEFRPSGGTAVFMSLYNVLNEFVIRAEMEIVNGEIRDACRAYGFDRITWLDDRTPVD